MEKFMEQTRTETHENHQNTIKVSCIIDVVLL